jgi:hypothetical protein
MSLKELRDRITHALQTITADMLQRVWDQFVPCGCVSCDPGCTHWRIVINAWETWTVAAIDGVCCARVRWEINFLLTFETAPFFCVYPVYLLSPLSLQLILLQVLKFVIKLKFELFSSVINSRKLCAALLWPPLNLRNWYINLYVLQKNKISYGVRRHYLFKERTDIRFHTKIMLRASTFCHNFVASISIVRQDKNNC